MNIKTYKFPELREDKLDVVESVYCELLNVYRKTPLDPEVLDWMDSANNWLISVQSKTF